MLRAKVLKEFLGRILCSKGDIVTLHYEIQTLEIEFLGISISNRKADRVDCFKNVIKKGKNTRLHSVFRD